MQLIKNLVLLAFLAGGAVLAYEHFAHKTQPPEVVPKPTEVSFVVAQPQDIQQVINFVAQTQSSQAVQINARVEGFLDARTYTEGQLVQAGDILFQMDPKPFQASLDQAKAALAGQEAGLTVAQEALARVQPLAAAGALSQKDLDDARGAVDRAAANVAQAQASVELAELNLSYTTIRSPVTGITDAALQQDGSYISLANSALTTVYLVSPMWVNFSVSENQLIGWKNLTQKGELLAPKDGIFTFKLLLPDSTPFPNGGNVTFASPAYDPNTGTFLVRGTFDNPQGEIRPNQYLTAVVSGYTRPKAILIPQRAVHQAQTGHFVWLIDQGGKSALLPVEVGDWQGDDWIITSGLKGGEKVIVDGLVRQPGMILAPTPYKPDDKSGKSD